MELNLSEALSVKGDNSHGSRAVFGLALAAVVEAGTGVLNVLQTSLYLGGVAYDGQPIGRAAVAWSGPKAR
jgi:hypothetical protein